MPDWEGLDEVEIAHKLLRAALEAGAGQISISCDNRGAEIFFFVGEELQMFDRISGNKCCALRTYLKRMAGIDLASQSGEGIGSIAIDGNAYMLNVKVVRASISEDFSISICKL